MKLDGKVAIVTGGAVRLGRALALALAGRGARLVIHYGSSAGPARETLAQIQATGGESVAIQADLHYTAQAQSLIARAAEHFGQLDVLVNSAAIFQPGDWADTTEANWDEHMTLNLKAPFFISQAFAVHVGPERHAHIVNIVDWRAARPNAHHIAYTLAKAALVTMTQSLALALAPNIQVNAIAPGAILPPPGQDSSYLDRLALKIPARRAGSPDDIARTLLFLLDSDFVTGDVIPVTGGEHLL